MNEENERVEERGNEHPAAAEEKQAPAILKKFKDVDALARAYEALQSEFTRRSQRLKQLEGNQKHTETDSPFGEAKKAVEEEGGGQSASVSSYDGVKAPTELMSEEEIYRLVERSESVRARVVNEYLSSLKGVPLMAKGGVGVAAPAHKVKSIAEAGQLALGYFRGHHQN